jgi:hypothetical protein
LSLFAPHFDAALELFNQLDHFKRIQTFVVRFVKPLLSSLRIERKLQIYSINVGELIA